MGEPFWGSGHSFGEGLFLFVVGLVKMALVLIVVGAILAALIAGLAASPVVTLLIVIIALLGVIAFK